MLKDGSRHKVRHTVIVRMRTIELLLEAVSGADDDIPVSNITGDIFTKVLEFITHHLVRTCMV
jgi:hypothetical protein